MAKITQRPLTTSQRPARPLEESATSDLAAAPTSAKSTLKIPSDTFHRITPNTADSYRAILEPSRGPSSPGAAGGSKVPEARLDSAASRDLADAAQAGRLGDAGAQIGDLVRAPGYQSGGDIRQLDRLSPQGARDSGSLLDRLGRAGAPNTDQATSQGPHDHLLSPELRGNVSGGRRPANAGSVILGGRPPVPGRGDLLGGLVSDSPQGELKKRDVETVHHEDGSTTRVTSTGDLDTGDQVTEARTTNTEGRLTRITALSVYGDGSGGLYQEWSVNADGEQTLHARRALTPADVRQIGTTERSIDGPDDPLATWLWNQVKGITGADRSSGPRSPNRVLPAGPEEDLGSAPRVERNTHFGWSAVINPNPDGDPVSADPEAGDLRQILDDPSPGPLPEGPDGTDPEVG